MSKASGKYTNKTKTFIHCPWHPTESKGFPSFLGRKAFSRRFPRFVLQSCQGQL